METTVEPKPPKRMTNLVQRVLTGIVGIPAVLGLIYLGEWPFALTMLVVTALAQYEFYSIAPLRMDRRHVIAGLVGGGFVVLYQAGYPFLIDLAVAGLLGLLIYDTFDRAGEHVWGHTSWMIAGVVYPALLISFLVRLRSGLDGYDAQQLFALTIAPLLLVWATDTLAYFTGRSLGKRPLAPAISPKKTWEGAIGGIVGALLVAVALKLTLLDFIAWPHIAAFGLIAGIGGQVGDLIESRLKRLFGVKDSGAILPGHGGILDRIDSLLLVVPVYCLYVEYVV